MWSDNDTSTDLLGFQHLVAGLLSIVRNDALLPATIGVFGDWGSGKSSLLRMAVDDLRNDESNLVLTFNGWLFEGHADAKTALLGNILDALAEDKTLAAEGKGLAVKLLKRVRWWRVVGTLARGGVGLAIGGPAGLGLALSGDLATMGKDLLAKSQDLTEDDLTKYLKESVDQEERRSIREFREDFGKLIRQTKRKRVIVVIDDLDRCLPETVIETLEAIKLFLFVEQTAFIIGADERLVKYAVQRRFPELPGERAEVGRDYLEKLIQFPIRVPPLGRSETETYVCLLFAATAGLQSPHFEGIRVRALEYDPKTFRNKGFKNATVEEIVGSVPKALAEQISLAERIAPVLATETVGNPRQCKRFLNMLSMRIEMARSRGMRDLQPRVFAKLMLLEYYRTESFRQLAIAQADENGRPSALAKAERMIRGGDGAATERTEPRARTEGKAVTAPADRDEGDLAADLPLWLADPWVTKWLSLDPALASEDLRPYFYFSRDLLGALDIAAQRMSPAAQESLALLSQSSDAVRKNVLKKAGALSPADAHAVFEALASRVRTEDELSGEASPLELAFQWVKERAELSGQLVTLLNSLPHSRVPNATPMKLVNAAGEALAGPVTKLLKEWSKNAEGPLKAASSAALRRQTR